MISLYAYILLSFLLPLLLLLDYATVYGEYFTMVVELTNSPAFRLLCVNSFVAGTFLLWFTACSVFFGKLNHTEYDVVQKSLPVYITECLVGPFYFGVSILSSVGAVSLLTVVVGLLHRLAKERATTLHIVEDPSTRLRMLARLTFFFVVATPLDLHVVFSVLANSTGRNEEYSSLHYCMAVLYLQFAVSNLKFVVQLLFTEVIGESGRNGVAFYVELAFSLIKSSIFFASFMYVSAISQAPFPLVRVLLRHVFIVFEKIRSLLRYRTLTKFMNSIADATEQDLSRDTRCAICYDDMKPQDGCKQLPCGHCYHKPCLRRWFETMSTCPYCRADLLRQVREAVMRNSRSNSAATANGNNDNATPASPTQEVREPVIRPGRNSEEHLQPLDEVMLQRAYARYLERFHAAQQQRIVPEVEQQQGLNTANASTTQTVVRGGGGGGSGGGVCGPPLPSSSSAVAVTGAAEAETAAHVGSKQECSETSSHTKTSTCGLQTVRPRTKELERLAAYMEYEKAINEASIALQRRLQAIESSL